VKLNALALFVFVLGLASPALAQDARWKELADLPFQQDYPTDETAKRLTDELLFERGVQSYLWALPAVNMWAMKQGSEARFGGGYNVLPVWKERLSARTLVTTPNSDVIYAMGYVDLGKDGPLVIDLPPGQQGILDDFWQRPIPGPTVDGHAFAGDVGFAGPDRGKGGKYLLVPPGYKGAVPAGYFVYRPLTNNVFVFWRAFFTDPTKLSEPVKLIEQTRIYPLGKKDTAKPMQFPDASQGTVNMLFPQDGSYFQMLSRFIDSEVVETANVDWSGMLAGIGICKGQPFAPDEHDKAILDAAAKTAFKMSKVAAFNNILTKPAAHIYQDRQWVTPLLGGYSPNGFELSVEFLWRDGSFRDLDSRIAYFTNYYAVSPGMISKVPDKGAAYLIGFKDSAGQLYSGNKSYKLHLPAPIPAANFWSLTLYDALTASGLDNGQPFPSLNSHDHPVVNADGSVDLYVGPASPSGKEANWLKSVPGKGYFVILRLYGPKQEYLSLSWKPSDLEETK
jgi:hypothetical protein